MIIIKFIFASDSFKGSLDSEKINDILKMTAKKVFPHCRTKSVLMADGGEGTMKAIIAQTNGKYRTVTVKNPLFKDISASYGCIKNTDAIIEMAAASGLPLVMPDKRNPLVTTTYGTGQLIADALDNAFRNIIVAIGGSATNDGGMGSMTALGVRFLDKQGKALAGIGENLEKVHDIDISKIHPNIEKTTVTVMCDVINPLLGENGATYTFGVQKGADSETLKRLENGMQNYAYVIKRRLGIDVSATPGGGAAGGLGAALSVFLNAKLQSGIETVLDLIDFDELIKDADLVITGEGQIDWQSAFGKVPSGVGKRCKAAGIPAIAIVGCIGKDAEQIYAHGIDSIISTVNGAMSLEEAMANSQELYASAAERMFRMIKTGYHIHKAEE